MRLDKSFIISLLLTITCVFQALPEGRKLINDAGQFHSNAKRSSGSYADFKNLLDADPETKFVTDDSKVNEQHYLSVSFGDGGLNLLEGENLVVVLTRPWRYQEDTPTSWNPTAMEILYSFDNTNDKNNIKWEEKALANVYFLNRGSGTTELSEPLPYNEISARIKKLSGDNRNVSDIKHLKFIVTMNNGRFILGDDEDTRKKGIRPMSLGGFQLYAATPGKAVVDQWIDRFTLDTDINYRYKDYEFVNTRGILHSTNSQKDYPNGDNYSGIDDYYDQQDKDFLKEHGINMPDYSFITSSDDADLNSANEKDIVSDKRQRTSTIEHLLYAVQGEPIVLYPYYTMPSLSSNNYNVSFVHWYDYKTGGHVKDKNKDDMELLGFDVDPSNVFKSDKYGWYASEQLEPDTDRGPKKEKPKFEISTVEDYKDFVKHVNKLHHTAATAVLKNSIDFQGQEIEPIGTKDFPWTGIFDGNNHTLSNFIITGKSDDRDGGTGVFGVVADGAHIENIVIEGSITGPTNVGVVGTLKQGNLTMQGIINHSEMKGGTNSSGMLGLINTPTKSAAVIIKDCAFTKSLQGNNGNNNDNAFIVGWCRPGSESNKVNIQLKNLVVTAENHGGFAAEKRKICRYENTTVFSVGIENCYDIYGYDGLTKISKDDVKTAEFLSKLNGGGSPDSENPDWNILYWSSGSEFPVPPLYDTKLEDFYIFNSEVEQPKFSYGTYATFFHPRLPFAEAEVKEGEENDYSLDNNLRPLCEDEFVIAADIAQDFNPARNIVDNGKKIYEPIIQFRHIFRVRDGKAFADEYMSSKEGNDKFIKMNRRRISASANSDGTANFQIRLDHPYPVEKTTRGVFYYKIDNTDYRRICSRIIQVKRVSDGQIIQRTRVSDTFEINDKDGSFKKDNRGEYIPKKTYKDADGIEHNIYFYPSAVFDGMGSRNVDGTNYYVCGGGGHFFRVLCWNQKHRAVPEGKKSETYIVQVIGTDYDGNVIYLADDLNKENKEHNELLVQEFEITFNEEASIFVDGDELYEKDKINGERVPKKKYEDIVPEALDSRLIIDSEDGNKNYDKIDFDEYRFLENLESDALPSGNSDFYLATAKKQRKVHYKENGTLVEDYKEVAGETGKYFRWPLPWNQSNYGFGYSNRHDYAMYFIANNTYITSHHSYVYADGKNDAEGHNPPPMNYNGDGEGLYDRLYYDTEGQKKGYFYYVNAADDPGIIARLRLDTFCPGSTVYVSCWIAELTGSEETANISFNFVARMKNTNERVPIHAHITGYVPDSGRGKWMYVYSSFVPVLIDKDIKIEDIDHYEIEIDNNCKSSVGADYCIDDIRVYSTKPQIIAEQMTLLCNDENKIDVRISANLDSLLESFGLDRAETAGSNGENETMLYYTILDKEKYDAAEESDGISAEECFEKSVLKFNYSGDSGNDDETYGKLTFSTHYESNPDEESKQLGKLYRRYDKSRMQYELSFDISPVDKDIHPDKKYILVILAEPKESGASGDGQQPSVALASEETGLDVERFITEGVRNQCAKKCEMSVIAANRIKIDGEVVDPLRDITACENQAPVVQVDIRAQKLDENSNRIPGDFDIHERNANLDWYEGTIDEFYTEEYNDIKLADALSRFRDDFPGALALLLPDGSEENLNYTHEDYEVLKFFTELVKSNDEHKKLYLSQNSYVFPPVAFGKNETEVIESVLAIPMPVSDDDKLICTQPTPVHLKVRKQAPYMAHGIFLIPYPDTMDDVPLRISLKRVKASTSGSVADARSHNRPLVIPLRKIDPATKNVSEMKMPEKIQTAKPVGVQSVANADYSPIYLVQTNDPEYRDLIPFINENNENIGNDENNENNENADYSQDLNDKEENGYGLFTVGEVVRMNAIAGNTNLENDNVSMVFYSDFYDKDGKDAGPVRFKEGYKYRFRFQFDENLEGLTPEEMPCSGHVVFTIKVVPEYQKWTGNALNYSDGKINEKSLSWNNSSENLNWNNDDNWTRVSSEDICLVKDREGNWKKTFEDYVTDGNNAQGFSYAPLDFTKVIIPERGIVERNAESNAVKVKVPELFDAEEYSEKTITVNGREYDWNHTPSDNAISGDATALVQYDMIQSVPGVNFGTEDTPDDGTYCRPWVAHLCDEIHFESGSEIGHQEHLVYKKAWVDFEVAPARWYTLSSPLQGVVAGDMYLPSAGPDNVGGRQNTTYFEPIEFDPDKHNRFNPAVFQRSRNLKSTVVKIKKTAEDGPGYVSNGTEDVMLENNWGNVYNDATVPYATGNGFSIKTDLANVSLESEESRVKFRLPKADKNYDYYTDEGTYVGDKTVIKRTNTHRLNEVSEEDASFKVYSDVEDNKLFLIGNPLMAHLNIAAFLDANSDVIESKYWILDNDRQGVAVMNKHEYFLVGTLDNPEFVAPLQGFFVEAKDGAVKEEEDRYYIELRYNSAMGATVNDTESIREEVLKNPDLALTRSGAEDVRTTPADGLRISDIDTGASALILFDGNAVASYDAGEDAILVNDPSLESPVTLYTVAEGIATSVNTLPEISSTEIGIIRADNMEVTLLFEGVDPGMGLLLYDSVDDSYTEMYDGMELKVDGNPARRLSIVSDARAEINSEIEIILMGDAVRVLSTEGGLTARVYDINGRLVDSYDDGGTETVFELAKGLYVVEAKDDVSGKTQKVLVR